MSRRSRRTRAVVPITVLAFGAAAAFGGTSVAAPTPGGSGSALTPAQRTAQRAGISLAPKSSSKVSARTKGTANPYLANLLPGAKPDYAAWQQLLAAKADKRVGSKAYLQAKRTATAKAALPAPLLYDEQEPAELYGSNDTQADAEPVGKFGTGKGDKSRVRILGTTVNVPTSEPTTLTGINEDNGQLNKAKITGINGRGAITASSVLGDGPHGTISGDGSNDYDFYRLTVGAGLQVTVDTRGTADLDTIVGLYDAGGTLLAADDDGAGTFAGPSLLQFAVPAAGTYYALVAGYGESTPIPPDPNDSGSGDGGNAEGAYKLAISAGPYDTDYYAVDLAKGDVLGGTVAGSATTLSVLRYDGARRVVSNQVDASGIYPSVSPLPGGGNTTFAYVAEKTGRYAVRVDGPPGRYDATLEAYRPGSEVDPSKRVQTVFLDFDGERLNTGIFGGRGVTTLSPFSAFIAKWGISRSKEGQLIDKITATVQENIDKDLRAKGINDKLKVKVINSRHSADTFGSTNVSRVVIGGTIEQSGVPTIGIAQSIDPGNYAHEETALVLLDVLSETDPSSDLYVPSLNNYMTSRSDRIGFVSRAIGNVTSHEIGHYIGNFHTDNADSVHNLMDSGGANFGQNLYGVGPDGIGGTADDEDIDYRTNTYAPEEGFGGREATLNVSAWAFVKGKNVK